MDTSATHKKILVIDDDYAILEVIQIILQERGYDIAVAADSEEIQKNFTIDLPNLILLDIWMSGQDGREIAKMLRNQDRTKHIPIVMISANNDGEKIAKEAGANAFLPKPFEIDDLISIVEKYIA
jgi:CheY-like chemotaxis protein